MKKVINGKMYDTTKAKLIGQWNYSNSSDLQYIKEQLYKKRTGEFFLYGQGGPASKYAEAISYNSWSGGSKIIPLTYESAKEWAEEYLSGGDYEEIFGEIQEDDSKRVVSVSITTTTHEKLKRMASEQGISIGEIIDNLIQ